MFKKLFGRKKELSEEEKISDLISHIEASIAKSKEDKKKFEADLIELEKWIVDIIHKVYKVPNALWYKELDKYKEIKAYKENQNISKGLIKKTDEVIFGYFEQIKIRKSKIRLLDALLKKYNSIKENYIEAEKKLKRLREEEEKSKELDIHLDRIKEMTEQDQDLQNSYSFNEDIINAETELTEIQEQFNLQKQFQDQMDNLSADFHTNNQENSLFIEQLEDIIKNVEKDTKNI